MKSQVKLISHTPDALNLLLYSKFTRLSNETDNAMDIINGWSEEKKLEEWDYMSKTIESSWELVNFVFEVSSVSRGFTHQLVRTRSTTLNAFDVAMAQQSQRTVTMEQFPYITPDALDETQKEAYDKGMGVIQNLYSELLSLGAKPQDARGVLPTNVSTSIIIKIDLRTLSHMMQERLCTRSQGEIQYVTFKMRELILEIYPWLESILRVYCAKVGTCRFANYAQCPIKGMQFNPHDGRTYSHADGIQEGRIDTRKDQTRPATIPEIQKAWEQLRSEGGFEAVPNMQVK